MKLSTNVMRFYQVFGIHKTIDIFAEAGFDAIEFNADLPEYNSEEHGQTFYEELHSYAATRGVVFSQAHAPFGSSFFDAEKTAQRFEEIVRSFRYCSCLGTEMIVVHPCNHRKWREENCFEEMFAFNLDFYRRLAPYAKEAGLRIAIENIVGSITETPEGLIRLLDELNDPVFTVCFDVGHAHMIGLDEPDFIRQLGSRIGCTHIHDNNGSSDQHTLPFYGTTDWEAVMQAFAEVNYTGNLNYEAAVFVKNVPAQMCPEAAKYMAQIGRYLIQRIDFHRNN